MYGTIEGMTNWASGLGLPTPAGGFLASDLQRGSDYIDATYGAKFCGVPTDGIMQERAYPRTGVVVGGVEVPPDIIPPAIIKAAYRAAYITRTMTTGWSSTINPNARIKRQKVDGAVEREFFEGGQVAAGSGVVAFIDPEIEGLLSPFLCKDESDQYLQTFLTIG